MVKSLVAIRDLECAFVLILHGRIVFCHPDGLDIFTPCPYKTMSHRSIDRGHVLTE